MTTNDSITQAQLEQLRTEAAAAGDMEQVRLCDLAAQTFGRMPARADADRAENALARCVQAINYAESMAGQV